MAPPLPSANITCVIVRSTYNGSKAVKVSITANKTANGIARFCAMLLRSIQALAVVVLGAIRSRELMRFLPNPERNLWNPIRILANPSCDLPIDTRLGIDWDAQLSVRPAVYV